MPKKLTDPRERYYDLRTGHYNLRYRGDSEVYSRTFILHKAAVRMMLDKVEKFSEQYVITGLFQFVEKPRYSTGGIGKIKVYQETRDFFALHGPNWKLDDAMVRGGKAYAKSLCSSLITVSISRLSPSDPVSLVSF